MNTTPWILLGIAAALLIPYRRIKPRDEIGHLFRLILNAPTLFICGIIFICFLFAWGISQTLKMTRIAGMFELATNPPAVFNIQKDQITLTPADNATLVADAKAYAEQYTRTNGQKPYVQLLLYPASTKSVHLFRQIKDALGPDWNIDINSTPTQMPITGGIWIYDGDPAHPSPQVDFWKKTLLECSLQFQTGNWGTWIQNDGAVIIINDPQYYY